MINVTKSDLPPFEEYSSYIEKIWDTHYMTNNGPYVQELERNLEEYLGVKNLLVVNNGTMAIDLAIRALDLSGEVITTPFTFVATASTILWQHCTPVFVDIDPETFDIDPKEIEKHITDKTSAIIGVHVFGNPCDVEEIQRIANKYNLKVIYDAAHAMGVKYKDKSVLKYGNISTMSFHATKVFHTIEGGALVINDDELYKKIKLMRNFGITGPDDIECVGTNAKMNEFQAAMGLCNLKYLEGNINKRHRVFKRYVEQLSQIPDVVQLQRVTYSKYNYGYLAVVLKEHINRQSVIDDLFEINVIPRKYFYPMLGNLEFFRNANSLEIANRVSNQVLCLPLYSSLEDKYVDEIVQVLKSYSKNI